MLRRLAPMLCLLLAACSSFLDSPRCVNNVECGLGVCIAGRCVAADAAADGDDAADEDVDTTDADDDPREEDTSPDVDIDTPEDVPPVDTGTDTPADTAPDTPVDTDEDTSTDTPVDSSTDTPFDSSTDAPVDTGTDTPVDTAPDTPPRICTPAQTRCDGDAVVECNTAGTAWDTLSTCANGCAEAMCLADPCESTAGYAGCTFFAVDLDNYAQPCSGPFDCTGDCVGGFCEPSAASQQFVVVASNTWDSAATVNVYRAGTDELEASARIGPRGLHVFDELPRRDIDGSELSDDTWRIESDVPITVHQFNPGNNSAEVFSNDASLLLPANSLGARYIATAWPGLGPGSTTAARSYVAIVASTPGTTVVSVVSPTETRAGADGTPEALRPRVSETFELEFGQVLALEASVAAGDMTGFEIDASQPVAVFGGSECANVPAGVAFCDHVEQQLIPLDAWGSLHVGAGFARRGTEADVWRVVGSADGTTLTLTPAAAASPPINGRTLNRGEMLEFRARADFILESTSPVSLSQFMVGSAYPADDTGTCDRGFIVPGTDTNCAIPGTCATGSGIGDPAFMVTVPATRFRRDYLVLTPDSYSQDYLNIIAPEGTRVTIDGAEPTSTPSSVGAWSIWREPVEDGVHRVVGDAAFGLYVYGYACDVSYAYPGGLQLGPG